jgi:hypothetical protein
MPCHKMIEDYGSVMATQCRLGLEEGHDGPCASPDSERSMKRRAAWIEGEKPAVTQSLGPSPEGPLDTLAAFQGPAQTTAQRYTDNPTPPPGKNHGDPLPAGTFQTRPIVPTAKIEPEPDMTEREAVKTDAPCAACQDERHDWCSALARNQGTPEWKPCPCYTATHQAHEDGDQAALAQPTPTRAPGMRPGDDQRLPTANDRPYAHDLVKADLDKRLAIGIERYGQGLQAFNGRNTFKDAYDEVLDQAVYLQCLLVEREEMRRVAEALCAHITATYGSIQPEPEIVGQARTLVAWLSQ